MSTWPDPEKPGVPLNPERDGWHWLKANSYGRDIVFLVEWDAHEKTYTWSCGEAGPARLPPGWTYLSPALTPAEADALRAAVVPMELTEDMRRAAGWAVVPVEPTDKMLDAVLRADWASHTNLCWADVYRIMIAAAPGVKP